MNIVFTYSNVRIDMHDGETDELVETVMIEDCELLNRVAIMIENRSGPERFADAMGEMAETCADEMEASRPHGDRDLCFSLKWDEEVKFED